MDEIIKEWEINWANMIETRHGITYLYIDELVDMLRFLEDKDGVQWACNTMCLIELVNNAKRDTWAQFGKLIKESCRQPKLKKYYKDAILPIKDKLNTDTLISILEDLKQESKLPPRAKIAATIRQRLAERTK